MRGAVAVTEAVEVPKQLGRNIGWAPDPEPHGGGSGGGPPAAADEGGDEGLADAAALAVKHGRAEFERAQRFRHVRSFRPPKLASRACTQSCKPQTP